MLTGGNVGRYPSERNPRSFLHRPGILRGGRNNCLRGGRPVAGREASSLTVLSSLDRMNNNALVLHVSVSRMNKLPTWEDLKCVKNVFMGRDVDAFHVIPKASDHVNLHNYTMHIWTPWKEACLTN